MIDLLDLVILKERGRDTIASTVLKMDARAVPRTEENMPRPKGTKDPEVTHKLELMAELIVVAGFSTSKAEWMVAQMWANGVHPAAGTTHELHQAPRPELLAAFTRGRLSLSAVDHRSVRAARERAEVQHPPRIPGTNPRRTRKARNCAGKKAMAIAIGTKARSLKSQVEALRSAYRDRGADIEQCWSEAYVSQVLDIPPDETPWVIG